MNKLAFVLLLGVVASALYMVRVQHEARRLFAELDVAEAEERRLESEQAQREVQKRALATSLRVEEAAAQKLGMRLAMPSITERVVIRPAAPAVPAAAGSGATP